MEAKLATPHQNRQAVNRSSPKLHLSNVGKIVYSVRVSRTSHPLRGPFALRVATLSIGDGAEICVEEELEVLYNLYPYVCIHYAVKMAQKCVHQGCGKEFTDPQEKCEYHPGPPVFHEGQKGKH